MGLGWVGDVFGLTWVVLGGLGDLTGGMSNLMWIITKKCDTLNEIVLKFDVYMHS